MNRIAAGEVIERPASVVKELVDNAIDAGATHIQVDIEDGGRELIRVIDDGGGIPPTELQLAFAPHATSKLLTDEDLFRILTLGFRGEALASIGSVSHSRILSRIPANIEAYEIHNKGGEISDAQASSGNVGTTVEVRNLFFNVPARRKFLKGTQTELGHITDMVTRLAVPAPNVSFRVTHNGRVIREYQATSAIERLLIVWPEHFRQQRLALTSRDAEVQVSGVIGLPELATPTPKYQHLYVNGRPVRDKYMMHAVREAFRGLMEPGRYPAAILMLTLPPGDVDVNVHPTKVEVRFRDSSRVHGLVMSSVREILLGNDLTPSAKPTPVMENVETARQPLQQRLADFFRSPPMPGVSPGSSSSAAMGRGEPFQLRDETTQSSFAYLPRPAPRIPEIADVPAEAQADGQGVSQFSGSSDAPLRLDDPPTERIIDDSPIVSALQLHNSYLVVQSPDGMLIIDQHALHERILYEDLLTKITRGPLESQAMLIPSVIRASTTQMDLLEQIQPMLRKLGIEVAPFGPDSIGISAFPSFLDRLDPTEFLTELLEKGEQELLDLTEEELLHEVLDMMSCKAAIKAGDALTPQEIAALIARKDLVERSSNCPHGRPTTLRLSLKDLEKQFKRTGF